MGTPDIYIGDGVTHPTCQRSSPGGAPISVAQRLARWQTIHIFRFYLTSPYAQCDSITTQRHRDERSESRAGEPNRGDARGGWQRNGPLEPTASRAVQGVVATNTSALPEITSG